MHKLISIYEKTFYFSYFLKSTKKKLMQTALYTIS